MNKNQSDKTFSDDFLGKPNNSVTREGVVKCEGANEITNSKNMNYSAYREMGAQASLVNRMARIHCFPCNEQSFENPCKVGNSNICLSDNGINRALCSTDTLIDDYSAVVNWLNFGGKRIRDVAATSMRLSDAHAGCYSIKDMHDNKNHDSYPELVGIFESSQEQALDLSCHKSNVNKSREPQANSDSRNEDTRSDQTRDFYAPVSFKCADENVSHSSIQLPSTSALCGTVLTTLRDSPDEHRLPTEQSAHRNVPKVYKPIPKYPPSIYPPLAVGFDPLQYGVLGHQLASAPYRFPANYHYPSSFYSLQANSQLPWSTINLNDANKAGGMGNSIYDKDPIYHLSSDCTRFDNKSLTCFPPSAACSTVDANLAKMSHLFPFSALAPLHPSDQNHLFRGLLNQQKEENTAFQSRQSKWSSGLQRPRGNNRDSCQSLTTPLPFVFPRASSQIARPAEQIPPHTLNRSTMSTHEQPDIRVNWPLKNQQHHSQTIQRSPKTDPKCTKPQSNQIVLPCVRGECKENSPHPKRPKPRNSIAFSMPTNKSEGHYENMTSNPSHVRGNADINGPQSVSSTNLTFSTRIGRKRKYKQRQTNTHSKSETYKTTKESVKETNSDRKLKRKWKQHSTYTSKNVTTENPSLTLIDKTRGVNVFSDDNNLKNAKRIFTLSTQEKANSLLGVGEVPLASNANTFTENKVPCSRNEISTNMPMVCGVDMRKILHPLGNGENNSFKKKVEHQKNEKEKNYSTECREYLGNHKLSNSSTNHSSGSAEARAELFNSDLKPTQARDVTNIDRAKSDDIANKYCKTTLCAPTNCHCHMEDKTLLALKLPTNSFYTSAGSNVAKSGPNNTVLQDSYYHPVSQGSNKLNYIPKAHQTPEANKWDSSIPVKEHQTKVSKIVDSDLPRRQNALGDGTCRNNFRNETPTNNLSSKIKNIETLISVDMNGPNAKTICCTTYKTRSVEDKAKPDINSTKTSSFRCKECDSDHHTFSALLQHQSIGCEVKPQSGAAPVHATDCVGNYMRHDAKWVGEKCQCTPCPICKGIFGSKFRVYTHLQRGCYKEKIMRYRPDMFRVEGLDFGNMTNSSEPCTLSCCSFKTDTNKSRSDANEGNAGNKDIEPSPTQKSQIMYVPQPKSRISKQQAVENSSNRELNKSESKHVPQNKRQNSLAKTGSRFEPRITLVTQGRGRAQPLPGSDASTQISSVVDLKKNVENETFNININENIKQENLTAVYVHGSSIVRPPSVSTNLQLTVNHPSGVALKKCPRNFSNNTRKVTTTLGHKPYAPTLHNSEEAVGLSGVKAENINRQFGLETNEQKNDAVGLSSR